MSAAAWHEGCTYSMLFGASQIGAHAVAYCVVFYQKVCQRYATSPPAAQALGCPRFCHPLEAPPTHRPTLHIGEWDQAGLSA